MPDFTTIEDILKSKKPVEMPSPINPTLSQDELDAQIKGGVSPTENKQQQSLPKEIVPYKTDEQKRELENEKAYAQQRYVRKVREINKENHIQSLIAKNVAFNAKQYDLTPEDITEIGRLTRERYEKNQNDKIKGLVTDKSMGFEVGGQNDVLHNLYKQEDLENAAVSYLSDKPLSGDKMLQEKKDEFLKIAQAKQLNDRISGISPKISPQSEADKMFGNWLRTTTKGNGTRKELDFGNYFDESGKPTNEFKKAVYEISGGKPANFKSAAKELLDFQYNKYQQSKSPDEQRSENMQNWLASNVAPAYWAFRNIQGMRKGAATIASTIIGVKDALLHGEPYGEAMSRSQKAIEQTNPSLKPATTELNPVNEAFSSASELIGELEGINKVLPFNTNLFKSEGVLSKYIPEIKNKIVRESASGLAQRADDILATTKLFGMQTYNDRIQHYHELGYSWDDAKKKAATYTAENMAVLSALPSIIGKNKTEAEQAVNEIVSPTNKGLKDQMLQFIHSGNEAGLVMGASNILDEYDKHIQEKELGLKGENETFNIGDAALKSTKNYASGFLFGAAMKALSGGAINPTQHDAIDYAIRNEDEFKKALGQSIQNGQVTKEQAANIVNGINKIKPLINEAVDKGLQGSVAVQYATEKAKYDVLNKAVSQMEATHPDLRDDNKLNQLKQRRSESAKDVLRIEQGTYLKGKIVSGDEMAKIAEKTKPEYQKPTFTKERKAAIRKNAPFVSDKIDLSTLKQDENVANNLSILENADRLQANVDEYDKLLEEKALIDNAHNEIKGVRGELPKSERDENRLKDINARIKAINEGLKDVGGIEQVKQMLEYNHDADNGYIVIGRDGEVINGRKQAATLLHNGIKESNVNRALTPKERAIVAKEDVPEPLAKDLGIETKEEDIQQVEVPTTEPIINEGINEGVNLGKQENVGEKTFEERTDKEHADYIKDKFVKEFTAKGVPKEQVDAAVALMEARAKASGKGDAWYRQIEDIGKGEFVSSDVKHQIIGEIGAENIKSVKESLDVAKEMESKGKTPKEIWLATGWEKTQDNGKWKYDLPDTVKVKDESLIKEGVSLPISEVFDLGELAKVYPSINNIKIEFYADRESNTNASYGRGNIHINLDSSDGAIRTEQGKISREGMGRLMRGLLHELQHHIQSEEGFAKGGNADSFNDGNIRTREIVEKIATAAKVISEYSKGNNIPTREVFDLLKPSLSEQESKILNNVVDLGHEKLYEWAKKEYFEAQSKDSKYRNLSGEVEARNVENRFEMESEERKNKMLSETEDTNEFIKKYLFQDAKGAVETLANGRKIIHALDAPDFSTAVHELAHVFEDELSTNDRETIQKWAGTKEWTTKTSETFARGFERYLRDGKAPTEALKDIFEKAKQWLSTIYKTLKGSPIEKKLAPEVRDVFDRLFKEKEITTHESLRTADMGENVGKEQTEETDKAIHENIIERPDEPMAKGGQSFKDFSSNVIKFVKGLSDVKNNSIVVTHNSVFGLIHLLNENFIKKGLEIPDDISSDEYKWLREEYTKNDNQKGTGSNFTIEVDGKRVFIQRHGETSDNVVDGTPKKYRRDDVPLNDKGREQAIEAGKDIKNQLNGEEVGDIISSPLDRAVETSNIIKEQLKSKENAIQEPSAESLHGSTQEGTQTEGGEHQGVGTSQQGDETTEESTQEGVGQRHEDIELMREDLGLEQMPEKVVKHREELEAQAENEIRNGYNVGNLVEGVLDGTKVALTDVEKTILAKYLKVANDELNNIEDVSSKEFDAKLNEVDRVSKAIYQSSTEAGRALQSIQNAPKLSEESLAAMMIREKEINNDADLTEQQKSQVKKEYEEIKAAKEALEAKVKKLQEEKDAEVAKQNISTERAKARAVKRATIHGNYVEQRKSIKLDIKKKLEEVRRNKMVYASVIPLPYAQELGAIAPDVAKMVKSYVEEGVVQLADIVKNIHEDLKGDLPNLTEADVRAVIAGRYNEAKPRRSDLMATITDLRTEAKKVEQLEALLRGEEPKLETKKREKNQKIAALTKEIKDFKLEKSKTEQLDALNRGKEPSSEPSMKKESNIPQSVKDINKEIKEHTLTKLSNKKKYLKTEIAKVQEKIDNGEYSNEVRKTDIVYDSEARKLQTQLIRLRQERAKRLMQEAYNNRNKWQKSGDAALELLNVPRTILSSGDFSAPLRQAIVATIAHPQIAFGKGGAFREMFKQGWSQERFDKWFHDVRETDMYPVAEKSGLYIADPHDPRLGAKEEQFMNNLAEKIPLVGKTIIKGSERAYVSYLNKLRFDIFSNVAQTYIEQGKTPENSPELFKGLASFINNSTGRGKMYPFLERVAPVLSSFYFSPRLISSRINLLNPYYYYKLPKEVRVMALKDMGKFIGVGLTILALAQLNDYDVEYDPRSSDFLKIKRGNTRYDIWGGFQQYVRVLTQLLSGQKKTVTTGDIEELNGQGRFGTDRGDMISNFNRGKLAPIPSAIWDIFTGRTVQGNKVTLKNEIIDKMIPLLWQDVYEASKDEGVKSIFTVGLPATFGVGTQTYRAKDYSIADIEDEQEKREKSLIPKTEDEINKMEVKSLESELKKIDKEIASLSEYTGNGENKDKKFITYNKVPLSTKKDKEDALKSYNVYSALLKTAIDQKKNK